MNYFLRCLIFIVAGTPSDRQTVTPSPSDRHTVRPSDRHRQAVTVRPSPSPCHVASRRVASRHVASRQVMSRRVTSSDPVAHHALCSADVIQHSAVSIVFQCFSFLTSCDKAVGAWIKKNSDLYVRSSCQIFTLSAFMFRSSYFETTSCFHIFRSYHVVTPSYLIIFKISLCRNFFYNLICLRLQNFISPLSGQPLSSFLLPNCGALAKGNHWLAYPSYSGVKISAKKMCMSNQFCLSWKQCKRQLR